MSNEVAAAEVLPPGKPLVGVLLLVSVSVLLSAGLAHLLCRGGPWAALCGAALGSWPLAAELGRRAFPERWPLAAAVTAALALLALSLGAAPLPLGDSTAPAWAEGLSDPWTLAVVSGLTLAVSLPAVLVQRWPRAGIVLGPALVVALVFASAQGLPAAWLVQVPENVARPAWALPSGAWLTHSPQGSTPLKWLLVTWVAGQALITTVTARLAFASARPTWAAPLKPARRGLALCALALGALLASGLLLLALRTPAALAPTLGASVRALPRPGPATSALSRLFARDPSAAPPVLEAVPLHATEDELSVWADLLLSLEPGVVLEGERRLWSLYASRSARGCQRAVSAAWQRTPERALLEAGLSLVAAGFESWGLEAFLAACESRGASKADQIAAVAAAHAALPDQAFDHLSPPNRGAAARAFAAQRLETMLLELGPERLSANPQAALDVLLAAHARLEPLPGHAAMKDLWRQAAGAIASQPSGRARLEQALRGPAHLRARATMLISCWDVASPAALGLAIQASAISFTGGARPPGRLVQRLRQAARSAKFPLKLRARAIAHAGPWHGLAGVDLRRWLQGTDEARLAALHALAELPQGAFVGLPGADHAMRGLAFAIERSPQGLEAAELSVHLFAAASESEGVRQRLIDTIEARAKAADDPARAATLKRIAAALAGP